jgi:Ca2+-binding EF-hand superfamily protein
MRLLFLAALLLWQGALAAARLPAHSRLYEQWQKADADGDTVLSRTEAAHMPPLAARFDDIDGNADGRISADEVRAWRRTSSVSRRRPRRSALDDVLAQADADGNGRLDRRELERRLPRMVRHFGRIDSDGDDSLSRAEIARWFAARRKR